MSRTLTLMWFLSGELEIPEAWDIKVGLDIVPGYSSVKAA